MKWSRIALAGLALVLSHSALAQSLDAAQQRLLKDAAYYMKDVDRELPKLRGEAERIAGLEDVSGENPQSLHAKLNQVNWLGQKLNNVLSRLGQLPGGNPNVAALSTRAQQAARALLAAETALKAAKAKLDALSSPDVFPEAEDEFAQLEALGLMIAVPSMLQSHVRRATETARQYASMGSFRKALASKYASLVQQQNPRGRRLAGILKGFDLRVERYEKARTALTKSAPPQIEQQLNEALEIAGNAVKQERPQLFSGAGSALTSASDRIALLEAVGLAPPQLAQLAARRDATAASIDDMRAALTESIIASNEPPTERYAGDDVETLRVAVAAAWKEAYPNDDVHSVRFVMQDWERSTGWQWLGIAEKWSKHDYSELQAQVVVRTDTRLATRFIAYLTKDHLKRDRLKIVCEDKRLTGPEDQFLAAKLN